MTDVAQNLSEIESSLQTAYKKSLVKAPAPPQLIAVSKKQPVPKIEEALEAGHRHFGENRIQEAAEKWPALLARYPDVTLHLMGSLQTNKVEEAVALFDVIHSVDRPKLVKALAAACQKLDKNPACFLQVNTGAEPQKSGVLADDLPDLLAQARAAKLTVQGLMCLPPLKENPGPHFARLHEVAYQHDLPELSMGMSGDYETAVRFGATYVRLGTAVFGARPE